MYDSDSILVEPSDKSNTDFIQYTRCVVLRTCSSRYIVSSLINTCWVQLYSLISCPGQIKNKEELIVVDTLLEEGLNDGDLPHLCLDKTLLVNSGHK